MKRFIDFIKRDFNNVRGFWSDLLKREIPFGWILLYYVLMIPVGLLLLPLVGLWYAYMLIRYTVFSKY